MSTPVRFVVFDRSLHRFLTDAELDSWLNTKDCATVTMSRLDLSLFKSNALFPTEEAAQDKIQELSERFANWNFRVYEVGDEIRTRIYNKLRWCEK